MAVTIRRNSAAVIWFLLPRRVSSTRFIWSLMAAVQEIPPEGLIGEVLLRLPRGLSGVGQVDGFLKNVQTALHGHLELVDTGGFLAVVVDQSSQAGEIPGRRYRERP